MAEPKFTPAPWLAEKASDTDATWAVKAEATRALFLAEVFDVGDGAATIEANARLIAAAPDLYEAVKLLLTSRSHNPDPEVVEHRVIEGLKKGLDALMKAEGRPRPDRQRKPTTV